MICQVTVYPLNHCGKKKILVSKIISLISNLRYQTIKDCKHIYATQEIVPDIASLNGQLVGKVLHTIWF